MCGIAGILNPSGAPFTLIKCMTDVMLHRGPDGEGYVYYENDAVALGYRRLSILDLSRNGAQPMASKDGRYTIVLNGEIYNFKELKQNLEKKGIQSFRGTSDTEVLLEYFSYFGLEKTLNDINGMFAIGLYDREQRKLTLIRDRGGEKPLYYGWFGDSFVFAFELKAIKSIDTQKNYQ